MNKQINQLIERNSDFKNKKLLAICAFDLRELLDLDAIAEPYAEQIRNYMEPSKFINNLGELEDYYICLIEFDQELHSKLMLLIVMACHLHDTELCHQKPLVLQ